MPGHPKLSDDVEKQVAADYANRLSVNELVSKYKVCHRTVYNILKRQGQRRHSKPWGEIGSINRATLWEPSALNWNPLERWLLIGIGFVLGLACGVAR